jgi:WD40 repeat protein
MRTRLIFLGACLVSCTSGPTASRVPPPPVPIPIREYAGVYMSTPDEDYFTPCGIDLGGDSWSLRFRDDEYRAPFLKKVAAGRASLPLTHFIHIRGRLSPPGSYKGGFQRRELAVDSVLDVEESLEPCAGFGVPAAWMRMPARFGNLKGVALSTDRRFAALMDIEGGVTVWSTEPGELVRKLGSVPKGHVSAGSYGPMTFSDDDTLLAVGGRDGIVRVWRPRDGKKIFSLKLKDTAAVARERARLLSPTNSPGIQPPLPNSYTATNQVVFNRLGTMLATGNLFSTIVWSMKTGKKLAEFNVGDDFRRRAFFVGDEGLLMTVDNARATLRSSLDAKPDTLGGMPAAETDHVAMTPDGRRIVLGTWSDSIYLWSVPEGPGKVLHTPGFITGVTAFSPDGKTVAIAGGMFGLYLYDWRTGAPIRAFHNFPSALSGAWFTADSKAIITLSAFDDRFRIVYLDPTARPEGQPIFDDSATARLPLGPPPTTLPRTIGGTITGPNRRAVADAEVTISDGDEPDSIVARAKTSSGGYVSFNGIRFRHVLIRAHKTGFAPGVKYIHLTGWGDGGPWGIELKPEGASH